MYQVLVLDAGGDPPLVSEVPAFFGYTLGENSSYNWDYTTEPQPGACQGSEGGECVWLRGKMLGGSGGHNGMVYLRGVKYVY